MKLTLSMIACGVLACVVSACTSTDQKLAQVSEGDILASLQVNKNIEQNLLNDYELIRQVSLQLSTSNIYDERLQPVNKTEKCLLPFMVAGDDNQQLYWDGACKNGYATGLGRAVRLESGIKAMEFLVMLDAAHPHNVTTYLRYDNFTSDAEVGYSYLSLKDNVLQGSSATLGYNSDEWAKGHYDITLRKEDTTNLVSYTRISDLLNGEVSSIIAYPNFSLDVLDSSKNMLSHITKTYRMLEGRNMVGLSYIWLRDGRLVMRDNATGQDSAVEQEPEELTQYISNIEQRVDANVATIDSDIEKGFQAITQYKNKKCRRFNGLFKGDEVNAICDYLDNMQQAYDSLHHARQARAKVLDDFTNVQSEKVKSLQKYVQH